MAKKGQSATGGKSQTGLRESYGKSKQADWSGCDAEELRNTVHIVAKTGGALRLGYSRDGGAYSIGVYGDGDPYTLYCAPDEDITATIVRIGNAFSELG